MTDSLVVFTPSGKRGRFPQGTTVLQAARRLGVDIDSVCGGRAICGRCQVTVSEGEFAKFAIVSRTAHLTPVGADEHAYAEKKPIAEGRRLACCARLVGDCVIDVPADSQVHRQIVRKRAEARKVLVDPVVTLHYVEVAEPDMHDPSGDLRRLERALEEQWDLKGLGCDLHVLKALQKALRQGRWKATVALRDATPGQAGGRIVAIWPGFHDVAYGLAVDIGSTTIAAHLCDLHTGNVVAAAGAMNPQIRFGEDLMSRVSYVMMNPGGDAEMTAAVREAIDRLAVEVAASHGIAAADIIETTVVGNPIMHHLFLGLDPTELGGAPFALALDRALTLPAAEVGLALHPGARVYVLPCIAGHVGADTAGVILSESPHTSDETMLVVDVGTNAELVLGNRHRLLAASSPTGPAFEGAQVSSGQRAAPGAIERVRVDPNTLEPRFKVIGCDLWSDDPGFAAATASSGVTGICGSGIIEALAEMYLAGILTQDGVIDGTRATRSPRVQADGRTFSYLIHDGEPTIRVTQNDVRAIQLAKAALYAGARLLMDRYGVDRVDRIVLTGAFGSHIDTRHAMVLGMIPDCPLGKVSAAGNAAGTGARIALVNRAARAEIEAVVRRVEKVETAVEPRFQEHFVEAMAIPHKSAPCPNLAAAVTLPPPKQAAASEAAGRERRRRRRGQA
ncbi:MAG: ASKHA domain-containing protein [Alphaproteobacteria bacterium]|nr:ASKHA domain-containing protein [Alphaproteobacteria bacterium]